MNFGNMLHWAVVFLIVAIVAAHLVLRICLCFSAPAAAVRLILPDSSALKQMDPFVIANSRPLWPMRSSKSWHHFRNATLPS